MVTESDIRLISEFEKDVFKGLLPEKEVFNGLLEPETSESVLADDLLPAS